MIKSMLSPEKHMKKYCSNEHTAIFQNDFALKAAAVNGTEKV